MLVSMFNEDKLLLVFYCEFHDDIGWLLCIQVAFDLSKALRSRFGSLTGQCIESKEPIVIKLEPRSTLNPQLLYESRSDLLLSASEVYSSMTYFSSF